MHYQKQGTTMQKILKRVLSDDSVPSESQNLVYQQNV